MEEMTLVRGSVPMLRIDLWSMIEGFTSRTKRATSCVEVDLLAMELH